MKLRNWISVRVVIVVALTWACELCDWRRDAGSQCRHWCSSLSQPRRTFLSGVWHTKEKIVKIRQAEAVNATSHHASGFQVHATPLPPRTCQTRLTAERHKQGAFSASRPGGIMWSMHTSFVTLINTKVTWVRTACVGMGRSGAIHDEERQRWQCLGRPTCQSVVPQNIVDFRACYECAQTTPPQFLKTGVQFRSKFHKSKTTRDQGLHKHAAFKTADMWAGLD